MNKMRIFLSGAAAAALMAAGAADASVTVNITQSGSDVVTSFSGSIDLTGLDNTGEYVNSAPRLRADAAFYSGVAVPPGSLIGYGSFTGPSAFGSGTTIFQASSAFGDLFAFNIASALVFLSDDYVSGSALSGGSVFSGESLASIGLTAGSYVYTGGNNTVTFNITGGAVPEPATWAMLLVGFGAAGAAMRYGRRKTSLALRFV